MQIEINPEFLASQGLSLSFPSRFWAKVNQTESCWLWTGCLSDDGYGLIGRGGKKPNLISAHRASWLMHFGAIPDGMVVRHRCEPIPQPACIRPNHLCLGTPSQNSQDAADWLRENGKPHWNARITNSELQTILQLVNSGKTNVAIALLLGISPSHVSKIRHSKRRFVEPSDGSGWII